MPGKNNLENLLSLNDREYIEEVLARPDSDHEFWDMALSGCKIRNYMLDLGYNQVTIFAEGGMAFQNAE